MIAVFGVDMEVPMRIRKRISWDVPLISAIEIVNIMPMKVS